MIKGNLGGHSLQVQPFGNGSSVIRVGKGSPLLYTHNSLHACNTCEGDEHDKGIDAGVCRKPNV